MSNSPNPREWSDEEVESWDTSTDVDEIDIKRNAIKYYLDYLEQYNKYSGYISQVENSLCEFQAFCRDEFDKHVCNISDDAVVEFNKHLKGEKRQRYYTITERHSDELKEIDIVDKTRYDYLIRLSSFYSYLKENKQVISTNPTKTALRNLGDREFDLDPPSRPRIPLHEMREFLQWLPTPFATAIILIQVKTGMRIGEVSNQDLCCTYIDHPLYENILEKHEVSLISEIKDKPDSIYVMPRFNKGTEIRGEVRPMGQKRSRGSVIPIDKELKKALLHYLLVRPPVTAHTTPGIPLFLQTRDKGDKSQRLTKNAFYSHFTVTSGSTGHLDEYGWYDPDTSFEEKVTLHYFRHYFTHNHKHGKGVYDDFFPKGVRKYIRGDVREEDDVETTHYNHENWNDWSRYIKEPYLNSVYKFNLY